MTESSNKHKTSMQVISNAWHSNRLLAYYNPTVLLYNRKSKYVLVSTVLKLGMLIPCSINTTKVFYNLFNFSYKRIHVPCCSESSQSIFERLCRVVLQYNFWLVPNTKWSTWKTNYLVYEFRRQFYFESLQQLRPQHALLAVWWAKLVNSSSRLLRAKCMATRFSSSDTLSSSMYWLNSLLVSSFDSTNSDCNTSQLPSLTHYEYTLRVNT